MTKNKKSGESISQLSTLNSSLPTTVQVLELVPLVPPLLQEQPLPELPVGTLLPEGKLHTLLLVYRSMQPSLAVHNKKP